MNKQWLSSDDKIMSPIMGRLLFELLQSRTEDAELYLSGTKLFADDLSNTAQLIAPNQFRQLMRNALACPDRELPFLLGHQLMLSQDPLACALRCAANLKQAIELLKQYQALWQVQLRVFAHRSSGTLNLDFCPKMSHEALNLFLAKVALSAVAYWLRQRNLRAQWQLPSNLQGERSIWQRYLGLEVSFDSQLYRVLVSPDALNHQPANSQQQTLEQCRLNCEQKLDSHPSGTHIVVAVQDILEKQSNLSLEDVSSRLDLSSSTLKRRLKKEGTSFQKLQDELNRYRALRLSSDLGWSNTRMAAHFKISDVNNFRRAFKRWTGLNPSQLKQIGLG